MKKHKSGYPQSRSFDLAPNAGVSEGRHIDAVSRGHGDIMGLSDKQHVTADAMTKEWGSMPYSQEQHSSGSMNYMSHKEGIAMKDAGKVRRPQKGVDNAS